VHSVPYSEHSSFDELLDFVSLVKPLTVVPTVSQEMFAKCEPLFVERCPRLRSKFSNTQPLSKFQHLFKKKPSAPSESATLLQSESGRSDNQNPGFSANPCVAKQTNPFAGTTRGKRAREGDGETENLLDDISNAQRLGEISSRPTPVIMLIDCEDDDQDSDVVVQPEVHVID
jgi:hypothetical protein